VRPVLSRFAVDFQVMHGYGSATSIYDTAQDSLDGEKYLEILYIGDFDPSGMHMSEVDLPDRIKKYGGLVDITRMALTADDCGDLPSFPVETKSKDPRHDSFRKRHGENCWELDAMNPNDLRERIRAEIVDRLDVDAWNHCKEVEDAERESLNSYIKAWPGRPHEYFWTGCKILRGRAMSQLREWARALGGEVTDEQVMCPGPGHGAKDRSLSVVPSYTDPGDIVVHSFAGDDPIEWLGKGLGCRLGSRAPMAIRHHQSHHRRLFLTTAWGLFAAN
jgi:hypothetical protein